jgi:hypothetical protein
VKAIRQVVGAIGAIAVLTACGGSDDGGDIDFVAESAANIQKASDDDMDAVTSLYMDGSVTQQGTEIGRELTVTTDGDCSGSISMNGQDAFAELLVVDGTTYLQLHESFWQSEAGDMADKIIKKVGDGWVQAPEGDERLASVCDFEALLDQVNCEVDTPEKGETADIDGQEAIELTSGGDAEGGGTTSVWVAVDDPHHILLLLQETSDSSSVSMAFSDFNEEVALDAPAEDDVTPAEELPSPWGALKAPLQHFFSIQGGCGGVEVSEVVAGSL